MLSGAENELIDNVYAHSAPSAAIAAIATFKNRGENTKKENEKQIIVGFSHSLARLDLIFT